MIKKNLNLVIICSLLVLVVLAGIIYDMTYGKSSEASSDKAGNPAMKNTTELNQSGITENRNVYNRDDGKIIDIYVTVLEKSDNKMTFEDMNRQSLSGDSQLPSLKVIFQEGDELSPKFNKFGYGEKQDNGIIEIRGSSTRRTLQQSYKIKLYENAGFWHDQKTINLNKHPYDITRVRNKLSFDMFKTIPNFTSLRTQFVRLHVKDQTSGNSSGNFEDYGLFTQVEQPNKQFLYSHGLDPNGTLYKAENFEFYRSPEVIKDVSDPLYNKDEFEKILNIRAGKDNKKLIEMLDAVNDYTRNINSVIDKYFDRDNYLTWLAVNILMGNGDTNSQNFILYNSTNADKWYFMPWDYDGAWGYNEQDANAKDWIADWKSGISNYWGVVLHQRFLKDPENRKQLVIKVEELSKIIDKEAAHKLLQEYYGIVSKEVKRLPDINGLEGTIEDFERQYKLIENQPLKNKQIFFESLEKPMPVFLGEIKDVFNKSVINWDPSYDFQGDDITYDFELAKDPEFKSVVIKAQNLGTTEYEFNKLNRGTYYWRVFIKDSKGNRQQAFDDYVDEFGGVYFGIKKLVIN